MVQNERYLPRLVDAVVEETLAISGAVHIKGPKYCGKTWTSKYHCSSFYELDLADNDYQNLKLARIDLDYALKGANPRLIDEWQLLPAVWDAVRNTVDQEGRKGMYILSGSSTPKKDSKPFHSGLGRIASLNMRTMTLYESKDSDGSVSLKDMFIGKFSNTPIREKSLDNILDLTMRGGWPGNLGLNPSKAAKAVSVYARQICYEDLLMVDSGKDPARMMRILKSLSRNESTTASRNVIAKDMKEFDDDTISDDTVGEYTSVLDRMCLIEDQGAFNPNLRSSVRVGKTPKRHLTDPALAISALGLTRNMLLDDLNTFGFMFEALCERDLQVYAYVNGGRLYHYRDGKGREIDAIVEMPDGRWGAFEIKLGADRIDEGAENLKRIDSLIRDDPKGRPPEFLAVICGMSSAAYRREDGVYVIPITSLGP
ncbi:MAG: ATP-binding protein [Candidatus Methanomethylophilaceae archaeon]|nr:ATP-binding protein [Candidatus Methanomethylophilaceae archaeon]